MKTYKIFILDHRSYCINSLGDSLAQMGHRIAYQTSWDYNELEAAIGYFKPEILITVGYNRRLFSVFIDRVSGLCQKYGLFHLYWATEDLINHMDWSLPYIQQAKPDLVWTIHPDCIEKYKNMGIHSDYLNFAFNPRIFPDKSRSDSEIYDISFIGAPHFFKRTYRFDSLEQLLFPLVKKGHKVNVWGEGWFKEQESISKEFGIKIPNDWLKGHIPYKKTSDVYKSSKIVLGVQNAIDQVTQRTFEILGSGAFMIASRTNALLELFEDKSDLVMTSSAEETVELVQYYLKRPELRYEIGSNAREKVLEKYTYLNHISKIWPQAELLIEKKLRNK